MNAHVNARDSGAKCEEVMARMRKEGVEPDVTSWTTLMNAHVNARDSGAKCEEVMARMRKEGVEPDVLSWNTLMNAYMNGQDGGAKCEEVMARMRKEGVKPDVMSWNILMFALRSRGDGDSCLSAFTTMRSSGVLPDSVTFSSLFSALLSGLGGSRTAGCHKVVTLSREYVTDKVLDHRIACVVLRALADVGSVSEVNAFWQHCARCLGNSKEGWPGSSAELLSGLSQRIGRKGQWPLIGQLVASAHPLSHAMSCDDAASRHVPSAGNSRAAASGGGPTGNRAGAPHCKFFHEHGHCKKGSSCHFTH
jgi:pentatricopeptide repeat protein